MPGVKHRIRDERMFDVINITVLFLFMVVILYPLIYILSASFSDPKYVFNGTMWLLPKGFTAVGYRRILDYRDIWMGYGNTLFYTVVGTVMNLAVTLPCAYALSRREMKGRNFVMGMLVVTMYVSGGLIPSYLNLKEMGFINTRWLLLITNLAMVHYIIISRTFFHSIPDELIEAATIDGCGNFRIFFQIVLPLSSAIIAVMALYYGVGHWNEYFNAMIGLRSRSLFPLQLFLRHILVQSQISDEMLSSMDMDSAAALLEKQQIANMIKYCVIVVSSAPMLMIYPFLQRYFIKGVMIGSIKG